MKLTYKGSVVHYSLSGCGDNAIVYLHGWGMNGESFLFCQNAFVGYKQIFIDFPPFGLSEEPKKSYTLFDYEKIVLLILFNENIKSCILVGHSFGGRVAILLSSHYNKKVKGLVLTASAGLKNKSIKLKLKKLQVALLRLLKKSTEKLESDDYKVLSQVMKKTFSNIVSLNLFPLLKNIKCQTFIFWGECDKITPLSMAKTLKKQIKKSGLFILHNAGHFAFLENQSAFKLSLKSFVKELV